MAMSTRGLGLLLVASAALGCGSEHGADALRLDPSERESAVAQLGVRCDDAL
jgi:hypothetical protein